jgi:tRNA uracil 4-sulfurtransferase
MKAIALISVGLDSPVAAHLIAQKGVEVIGLNCTFEQSHEVVLKDMLTKSSIKVCYQASVMAFHQSIPSSERKRCILCKRHMYILAEKLAIQEGADFLITGENIGQVASQTIENMAVISSAVKIMVIRPLLCMDKNEIINMAKKLGLYDLSIKVNKECAFVPKDPATRSELSAIKSIEQATDGSYEFKRLL